MEFWRFAAPDGLGTSMPGTYNLNLVALSIVIAALAASCALAVVDRMIALTCPGVSRNSKGLLPLHLAFSKLADSLLIPSPDPPAGLPNNLHATALNR